MSQAKNPESPTIRPPSEWRSLLVRLTRGCKWNRCRFCGIYPALGQPEFSLRTIKEIKHDIDLLARLHPRAETAFFGDADPLEIGVNEFIEIARYLRQVVPVKRLTCYARASTLSRLEKGAVERLAKAGLNRVHLGLESGDAETLNFHRKGQSPKIIKRAALRLKNAGIEISFYVLLGLGGKDNWQQHIRESAKIINATKPEFIRLRRLWLYGDDIGVSGVECPLWREIRSGEFIPQTPEGTVLELKLLIEQLDRLDTFLACDHANNYINVSGTLRDDREEMLAEINEFLSRPKEQRQTHYIAVESRI